MKVFKFLRGFFKKKKEEPVIKLPYSSTRPLPTGLMNTKFDDISNPFHPLNPVNPLSPLYMGDYKEVPDPISESHTFEYPVSGFNPPACDPPSSSDSSSYNHSSYIDSTSYNSDSSSSADSSSYDSSNSSSSD